MERRLHLISRQNSEAQVLEKQRNLLFEHIKLFSNLDLIVHFCVKEQRRLKHHLHLISQQNSEPQVLEKQRKLLFEHIKLFSKLDLLFRFCVKEQRRLKHRLYLISRQMIIAVHKLLLKVERIQIVHALYVL